MEPDETKNDAHGFGYTLVVSKRHGLVQRDFDHLDKLSLLWLTSTWADAVVIGHLSVKHGLLGTSYTYTRPGGETKIKNLKGHLLSFLNRDECLVLVLQYQHNTLRDQNKELNK